MKLTLYVFVVDQKREEEVYVSRCRAYFIFYSMNIIDVSFIAFSLMHRYFFICMKEHQRYDLTCLHTKQFERHLALQVDVCQGKAHIEE